MPSPDETPRSGISRRGILGLAAAGAVTATLVAAGGWKAALSPVLSPAHSTVSRIRKPLFIPPLAEGALDADGTRVFELTAQAGETDFLGGPLTPTWGYNGSFGGPTLRAAQGERVRITVRNKLDEVTTTHWHGMMLPAQADGGPHQPIHPGKTWEAEWTIEQPAATLWYHPHNHGTTEAHVYRGLAGMFLIDDADRADSLLPHEYGTDDIPVILSDRSFTASGEFSERFRSAAGMLGDTVLVNGTISPRFEATRRETRLRILNGSTARTYRLQANNGPMLLVGTDAGLLPQPEPIGSILLTPGERAEVVVTLDPGDTVMLSSLPHSLGLLHTTERSSGALDKFEILEITRAPGALDADTTPLTDRLATMSALLAPAFPAPSEPDERRTVTMQDNKLNHRRMNMRRIDDVVTVGDRERWFITNDHFLAHNLHIHNARFRVHSIDGQPPAPELTGWKDTVYAPPSRTVVIDVEYGSSTDPHLPYMYHCHMLQHEDQGMMAQFVVVQPGEAAGPLISPALDRGNSHDGH